MHGLNESELQAYFNLMISYDNMTLIKTYVSGNYEELFPEHMEKFVKQLHKHIDEETIAWNTLIRYTDIKAKNTFYNLHYLSEGYSVEELHGIFPEDIPTIVVSAGPSLNKNIMDLKKAVGKACIIATDTAMKPFLNAGIIPNLFVIIDGLKPGILFEHKDISKVPMVTMTGVSVEPMEYHKGKKFFYYSSSPLEHQILLAFRRKRRKKLYIAKYSDRRIGGNLSIFIWSLNGGKNSNSCGTGSGDDRK
ncbi:MAG: 6-hydroxymethylpterin diphosphokinase MptE-like protein [Roseburia faecis]